jgi:hypothetical protein
MEPLRGMLVGREISPEENRRCYDGERQLLAAIIVEAIRTAQAGGAQAGEAAQWLATVGCEWCERFLNIEGIGPADWQRLSLKAAHKIIADNHPPLAAADRERGRRYRERLRSMGVQRMRDLPKVQ